MTTDSTDAIRGELLRLGARRRQQDAHDKELTDLIKETLVKTSRAGITKTEAARLLGVHRTTLYRVYNV